MERPHRKRKITYTIPGHAHFLTYSCFRRYPLLSKDRSRGWVVEVIDEARRQFDFALWAYVIMPEHVHLPIHPRQPSYSIERVLAALKRPVSSRTKAFLVSIQDTHWLERLTVKEGRDSVFRFWQTGGGHDHNLWNDKPVRDVIEYIHANPVQRSLVAQPTDWMWSSARQWAGLRPGALMIDPIVDGSNTADTAVAHTPNLSQAQTE
jgi:putative transposase